MSNPKEHIKVESLTLSQIIKSLKPGQAWAIIVITFGLLSGSFGLGYKLKSSIAESVVAKYKSELATSNNSIRQFRGLQTKERFLALYLRYLMAKDSHAKSESDETLEAMEEAALNFRSYIEELLKRGEETKDEIDLQGLFLGKSGTADATVKFGYDGSIWKVPREFGFAAYSR